MPLSRFLLLPALLLLVTLSSRAQDKPADAGTEKLFRDTIAPLLANKCLSCHAADKKKGKLDLTRRASLLTGGVNGPAITPGKPDDSLLLKKLRDGEMPPQNPLTPQQIDAVRQWIAGGAPFTHEPLTPNRAGADWWSLRKPVRPVLPTVKNAAWVRQPVDAFVLATLEAHGLTPAPEADRRTWLRRVTFDLIGLPPTPVEIEQFRNDTSSGAYEKVVDRLLASSHYGERRARHWLDVVRFAESQGYETNELRPNAWPYRDYVIRAFNQDIPYPQFVREQLAGDALADADALSQSATGFLVGGAHDVVGNQAPEGKLQQRMDDIDDVISATGATFLGLTVNCARCHDHKFDPIAQKDYYRLQAIFAGVQHTEREIRDMNQPQRQRSAAKVREELTRVERALDDFEPLAQPEGKKPARRAVQPEMNVERFAPVEVRYLRLGIAATNDGSEPCIDELEVFTADERPRNVALASAGAKASASSVFPNNPLHKLEHVNDSRYGNGRSWISNERGKGVVTLELAQTERIDRVVWGRDREGKFRDRLATDYRLEVAVSTDRWQLVAGSNDRLPFKPGQAPPSRIPEHLAPAQREQYQALVQQRDELAAQMLELSASRRVYAGTFTQPGPTHVLLRGDPMRKGDVANPGTPAVLKPLVDLPADASERERRLALARWIGSEENPLAARVMVNRVWHYHFGQGIVSTPSDFGFNGDKPSHPELLDWLACEFATPSPPTPLPRSGGEGGWRLKPLHRMLVLSATYRQSSQTSDKALSLDRGSRLLWRMAPRRLEAESLRDALLHVSGKLNLKAGGPGYSLWEKNTNYVVVFKPKAELGPEEFRRMIYQFKPRSQQDPTFGVFDCPDAALARPKRTASTTVLQALNLLNGKFLLAQADFFAERLQREAGDDVKRQVQRAFHLAFGRAPSEREQSAAEALVKAEGLAVLCRALFNANEFVYID